MAKSNYGRKGLFWLLVPEDWVCHGGEERQQEAAMAAGAGSWEQSRETRLEGGWGYECWEPTPAMYFLQRGYNYLPKLGATN